MPEQIPNGRRSSANMDWRGGQFEGGAPAAASRRRLWAGILLGLLIVFLGLAAALLFAPHAIPDPAFLSISMDAYENFPVLPFARQDSLRLERHFDKPSKLRGETKTKQLLIDNLGQLPQIGAGRPLIVHITALGLVRGNVVNLVPIEATPDTPKGWVELETVMDILGKYKEPKLLILDLCHPFTDASRGVLSDRVAEVLQAYLIKKDPDFRVIVPCSEGQVSLTSVALQSSVFTYYLDKGLEGEADGHNADKLKDNRVTVDELFAYVKSEVEHWAAVNRLQPQIPRMFGKGESFTLVSLERSFKPDAYKPEPAAYPEPLRKGFAIRDAWSDRKDVRLPFPLYQSLENQLMRQEQRWRGGYALQALDVVQTAEEAFGELGLAKKIACADAPVFSLLAAAPDSAPDPLFVEAVQAFLESVPEGLNKDADLAKLRPIFDKLLQEKKDANYFQKARAIVEALTNLKDIHANQVRMAVHVLESKPIGQPPGTQFIEPLYLQRLVSYADGLLANGLGLRWRSPAVHQGLKTMTACEQVVSLVSREPMLIPWAKTTVDWADIHRREGEKDLFWENNPSQGNPREKWLLAEEDYKTALRLLRDLQRSRLLLGEAFALLPGYQPLLSEWPEYDPRPVDAWHKAIASAKQMEEFFKLPDPAGDPLRELDPLRIPLEENVKILKDVLQQRLERADKAVAFDKEGKPIIKTNGPEIVEMYLGLLRSPLLKSSTRVTLHQKLLVLETDLQSKTQNKDIDKPTAIKQARGWDPLKQALVRARLSLEMLSFNGFDGRRLQNDILPTIRDLDRLPALEKSLLEAWSKRGVDSRPRKNASLLSRQKECKEYISWMTSRFGRELKFLEAAQENVTEQGKAARAFFNHAKREFERLENFDP